MNILIVDDTEISLTIAKMFIEFVLPGQNIEFANNAKQALEKTNATKYSFIFTDLCMPVMNGDLLAKEIVTTDNKSKNARIFICSSREPLEHEEENVKLYCEDFLHKPLTAGHMQNIFSNLLLEDE